MKRTKIFIVIFAIVLAVLSTVSVCAATIYDTVYTPSGTAVTVSVCDDPMPMGEIDRFRLAAELFYDVEFLATPTYAYNCHSYAWIDQSTSNPYWLTNPTPFIQDPYYAETTTPEEGDIIVYYTASGVAQHSGVIDEVLTGTPNGVCGDSNLYMVISKWAEGALYRQRGDECAYAKKAEYNVAYVKYYSHNHQYTYAPHTIHVHLGTCVCGKEITEAHTWVQINELSGYRCTVCNYRSNFTPANPENVSAEIWMRLMAKTAVADGTTFVLDDMVFCYMDGQYYIVTEYTPDVVITPEVIE